jgi:hypothetical protein
MENINKEEFIEYLLQGRKARLNNLKQQINNFKRVGGITQSEIWPHVDIWSNIRNSSDSADEKIYPAKKIYEQKFLEVLWDLLELVLDDNFFKSKGYKIEQKAMIRSVLMVQLLNKPIAIMLNKHLKTSNIDLKSVENDPSFSSKIPQYLKDWKDEDKELFFNNLWKILEEIKFTDEEIGSAWRSKFL